MPNFTLPLFYIMMFNTTYLNKFISQRTKKFAHDLTYQHAANINKEFNTRMLKK